MSGNTFQRNTGLKGLLYLEFEDSSVNPRLIIANNLFKNNGGYFDTSLIHLRAVAPVGTSVYTQIPSDTASIFCTGYHFMSNEFTKNLGCPLLGGGLISLKCLDYDDVTSQSVTNYND